MSSLTSRLRHKVVVEEKNRTPDEAGGYETEWVELMSVWAEIFHKSSAEKYLGGQLAPNAALVFRVRFHAGITTDMRLRYDNRIFAITALSDVREEHKILDIMAVEEY